MGILDEIAHLHPRLRYGRDRRDLAQDPVRARSDDETAEEVQVIDVLRALGDRLADSADEADDIDQDAGDVGGITAPVEAEPKVVGGRLAGGVQLLDLQVAASHEVIIGHNDTSNRREEDGVGGQVGREVVGRGKQVPWAHDETDKRANVAAATNVEVAGQESGHVGTGGDGVGCNVRA